MTRREYARQWRLDNLEHCLEYDRMRRQKRTPEQKDRIRTNYKAWAAANRAKIRRVNLKSRYGMTMEELQALRQAQHDCCGLCLTTLPTGSLAHIDHNHTTGRVRGWLCNVCNTRLSVVENSSPEWMTRATNWIRRDS